MAAPGSQLRDEMLNSKLLLVGPYPPPHGGVSVHVWNTHTLSRRAGIECKVLNIDRSAPSSDEYVKISSGAGFIAELLRHAFRGWTLHAHTNGHNTKSWAVALVCGIAAQFGPGGLLTLHSGMMPAFVSEGGWPRRALARLTCALYRKIICVNDEIAGSLRSLGVAESRIEIAPAYLPVEPSRPAIPADIEWWLSHHSPVITSTMFFRPEYGFDLLVQAASVLREKHPRIGFLVFGSGEERAAAEALVHTSGLGETVFLPGDVHHDLCLALMARSSVFIRPTYHDGDSISVREALSFGIPVVASNVGTRPPGVRLFEVGDVEGLTSQMEVALTEPRSGDTYLATGVSPWSGVCKPTSSAGGAAQQ
jgi:glycosyltransferase involved in cell wall biosynthesis